MEDFSANVPHQVIETSDTLLKCYNMFSGPAKYYLEWGLPLCRAAMESDWKTAEGILKKQPNLATAVIYANSCNALHVAAGANSSIEFIKELVDNYMTPEDLALQSGSGNTALSYLAQYDNVEAAKFFVEKNGNLPSIPEDNGYSPLLQSVICGHRRMALYLLSVTDLHQLTSAERFTLLAQAICTYLYDLALELLNKFPDLALYKDECGRNGLQILGKLRMQPDPTQGWRWWTKWIGGSHEARMNRNMEDKGLELVDKLWGIVVRDGREEQRLQFSGVVIDAAIEGDVELIAKIVGIYPPSLWTVDTNGRNIFGLAILNRKVDVFNLIHETQGRKIASLSTIDKDKNNGLHLAAILPPLESLGAVNGAALQMQRELMWFKEIENSLPVVDRSQRNTDGHTPQSLFTENHETLRKEGEKWMKTTATSCLVVAALVATVAFTAVLTVPGGNEQKNGIPNFQHDPVFVTFAIADALSLISSSTSIVMFLGILTSRYAQDDFLKSLPLKLLIGLSALLFSIAFMMVAFASTFFIIFKARFPFSSIPVVVAAIATIPVHIFAFDQFPLLLDIYRSTYGAKYLFRNNHKIYREKKSDDHSHWLKKLVVNCLGKNN